MIINNICSPAIIYLGFSLTQIIIDIYKTMYNTAFLKFIVSIIFTIILNILCERNLHIISWIIVFIPFIFMTVITTILLYMFGLDPFFGKLKYDVQKYDNNNNLISDNNNNLISDNNNNLISDNNNNLISDNNNNLISDNNNNLISDNNINYDTRGLKHNSEKQIEDKQPYDNNILNNRNFKLQNQNNSNKYLLNNMTDCKNNCLSVCNSKNISTNSNYCNYTCDNICEKIIYN